MTLEQEARHIFRAALVIHYIEGLPKSGELVNQWLQEHRGWFPDPQELYGDGTPMTQPKDEGVDVTSPDPIRANSEATAILKILAAELQTEEFIDSGYVLEQISHLNYL